MTTSPLSSADAFAHKTAHYQFHAEIRLAAAWTGICQTNAKRHLRWFCVAESRPVAIQTNAGRDLAG